MRAQVRQIRLLQKTLALILGLTGALLSAMPAAGSGISVVMVAFRSRLTGLRGFLAEHSAGMLILDHPRGILFKLR